MADGAILQKRKRVDDKHVSRKVAKRQAATTDDEVLENEVKDIENNIAGTAALEPGIRRLLEVFGDLSGSEKSITVAAVALCRIFYRQIAAEALVKKRDATPQALKRADWLRKKLTVYVDGLCRLLGSPQQQMQKTALTLIMRLVKAETSQPSTRSLQAWRTGVFYRLVHALISSDRTAISRQDFVETFIEEHDDVRYFTYFVVHSILSDVATNATELKSLAQGALDLMVEVEVIPDSKDQLQDWYGTPPDTSTNALLSLKEHKKYAQAAWLSIFKARLGTAQRKQILSVLTERVVPWFTKPETLMDFLTDCYNESGAISLLALEGVFFLIKERNLDYPHFYHKLYSLLDADILHSKYRARFFRLLEIFLHSTHLPAALVASFIKRLARLALHAPPGGIVMVIPWTYNMLKRHPQCTLMIHRESGDEYSGFGVDDPFLENEEDPMRTLAIDSSLWELQSLQHHYHPNVATLAKIISEQFTKQEYSLDDFLDHTYDGLIEAELGKDMKRAPVVEYEILKHIIMNDGGALNDLGLLLQQAVKT